MNEELFMQTVIAVLVFGFVVVIYLLLRNRSGNSQIDNDAVARLEIEKATLMEKVRNYEKIESELKYALDQQKDEVIFLRQKSESDQSQIVQLETTLQEQKRSMQEKLELLEANEAKLKQAFTNLANEILEKSSKKLQEESEKGLGNLLNPMKIQLADFKKKVEDVYDKEAKDRTA